MTKHEKWKRLSDLTETVFERQYGGHERTVERIVIREDSSGRTWYAQRQVGAGLMVVRSGMAPTVDTCWTAAVETIAELAFEDVAHLMVGG